MPTKVLGRAWIYDTGDPCQVEVWVQELVQMKPMSRGGAEWAHEHFAECYSDEQLRELFKLPPEGNFQVLFSGDLDGAKCGPWEAPDSEWDEWFELDDCQFVPIPDEWMQFALEI